MRNKSNPGGADIGPGPEWGKWREKRNKAIAKPRKNRGAMQMAKMERERAAKATDQRSAEGQ